ncbi:MAG: hypothetical protein JWM27_1439 [Gemmatimonadetes bacterium]|nr:hypothetical protein [Gemmatimonadota bacterium]
MNEQLQARLDELKSDFVAGQARLAELDRQQAALRETLLRISGAIQVIEELQADSGAAPAAEPQLQATD